MKREDLEKAGLSKEQIDSVMELHGKDIEAHKTKSTASEESVKTLQEQLTAANKQIEEFKGMNIDQIKAAADDYKTKYEQAQTEHAAQLAQVQFDHALDTALAGAKVRNAKATKALLSIDDLKDAKGELLSERLTEQLTKIKTENDYLFEGEKPLPQIVTRTQNQSGNMSTFEAAARKGAGLPG